MSGVPDIKVLMRSLADEENVGGVPVLRRSMTVSRGDTNVDADSRTVQLSFVSDKPIDHYFGALRLSFDNGDIREDRIKDGMALLVDHDMRDHIGVIESYEFKGGVGRVTARFGRSARADEIFNDVADGIRRNVSVGFMIHEMEVDTDAKQNESGDVQYVSRDWEPYEISIVSVPADITVGFGRNLDQTIISTEMEKRDMADETITPQAEDAATAVNTEQAETPAVENVSNERSADLLAFGRALGREDIARSVVLASADATVDDVRQAIRTAEREALQPAKPVTPAAEVATRNGGTSLATVRVRHGKLKAFTGEGAEERAYRFGRWATALMGLESSTRWCKDHGIKLIRGQVEGTPSKGGYLVPDEFGNDIVDNREAHGVFRRNTKVLPMSSNYREDPVRLGGLVAVPVGEAGTMSYDETEWGRVALTARKWGIIARASSELTDDSVLNIGDELMLDMGRAFALAEDTAGFMGDGTGTYNSITGVTTALKAVDGTIGNIAGLVVGTGNAYSELTLTDFTKVAGRLPVYAQPGAKWYMNKNFYYEVVVPKALGAGGVTAYEVENFNATTLLSYPVEFTDVMPKVEANSQVCAVFGDLSLGTRLGNRREVTIDFSEHVLFESDEIAIRATSRFDINVHDVGNASATASARIAGPIVGLITAGS